MCSTEEVVVFGVPFSPQSARKFHAFLVAQKKRIDFTPMVDLLEQSGVPTLDGWYDINNYRTNLEWRDATEARGDEKGTVFAATRTSDSQDVYIRVENWESAANIVHALDFQDPLVSIETSEVIGKIPVPCGLDYVRKHGIVTEQ